MGILKAYFDDSGDENDPNILTCSLGGYVGTIDNWQYFETEWNKVLFDHDIPYLHMKDFAHNKRKFEKYANDKPGRDSLLESLIRVIEDSQLEGFVSSVYLNDIKDINKHIRQEEQIDAYALNLYTCMRCISNWPKTNIEILLDRANDIFNKIPKALIYAKQDKHYKDYDYLHIIPLNRRLSFKKT